MIKIERKGERDEREAKSMKTRIIEEQMSKKMKKKGKK